MKIHDFEDEDDYFSFLHEQQQEGASISQKEGETHDEYLKRLNLAYGYGPSENIDEHNSGRNSKKNRKKNKGRFYPVHDDYGRFFQSYSYKPKEAKDYSSYDFLQDLVKIHNQYPASASQPNPFSLRAVYIIDILNKLGVRTTSDIFNHSSGKSLSWGWNNDSFSHKLLNIIAEPNQNTKSELPAILFVAHHDVSNIHSENAQDNSASVCNLLRLASIIQEKSMVELNMRRVVILFSDCEETGTRGAKRMADEIKTGKYGNVSEVINLELTGKGKIVWADYCSGYNNNNSPDKEKELAEKLKTCCPNNRLEKFSCPPNDAPSFRSSGLPALCIGILPENDIQTHSTWRLCHSLTDTIEKCDEKDMTEFVEVLVKFVEETSSLPVKPEIIIKSNLEGPKILLIEEGKV